MRRRPFKTFTGVFHEGPEFDETRYAREVAAQCRRRICTRSSRREQHFVDLLPRIVYHMDEPVAGPGLFPQYIVARCAAADVKVVLGRPGRRRDLRRLRPLPRGVPRAGAQGRDLRDATKSRSTSSRSSRSSRTCRRFGSTCRCCSSSGAQDVFEPMDQRYFRLVDRSAGALQLFSDDFRARYDREDLFARFQAVFNHPDTQSYYNKMTHFDLVTGFPALLHVEDRVSMAASLESRVPLLDHRLADLVTSMPPRMKFRGGELKYVLKRAARPTCCLGGSPSVRTRWASQCRCICGPRARRATSSRTCCCRPGRASAASSITPRGGEAWTTGAFGAASVGSAQPRALVPAIHRRASDRLH